MSTIIIFMCLSQNASLFMPPWLDCTVPVTCNCCLLTSIQKFLSQHLRPKYKCSLWNPSPVVLLPPQTHNYIFSLCCSSIIHLILLRQLHLLKVSFVPPGPPHCNFCRSKDYLFISLNISAYLIRYDRYLMCSNWIWNILKEWKNINKLLN